MLQPMKFVRPTLAVVERNKIPLSRDAETEASDFFSGAVIDEDNHFNGIEATWMVPKPYANGDDDKYYSAAWIGLDGFNSSDDGSDDVLQAGTEQDVQDSNTRDSYVWFGWLPADPLKITNFPVSPGDTVSCSVGTFIDDNKKTKGAFSIYNWNTQLMTYVTFDKPNDVTFKGDSAEWIMEDTSDDGNHMAQFGAITFRSCSASGDSTKDLSDATLLDIYTDSDDDDSDDDDSDHSDLVCEAVKESNAVLVISNPKDLDAKFITATTSTIVSFFSLLANVLNLFI